jgi:chromosome segregation ATPase
MDNEQLEKRIKWLDDERRKDKNVIADLENKLQKLEEELNKVDTRTREYDSDITRLRTSVSRVDDFEADLGTLRVNRKKEINDQEKLAKSWISDAKKELRAQLLGIETQQKKLLEEIKKIKILEKDMQARVDEETRFNATLREIENGFDDIQKDYKDFQRDAKTSQQDRQKLTKRVADIQAEQSALRKRVDEVRGMMDLVNSDYQKIKGRIEEMESSRRDLKKEQESFLESANLKLTERETLWKNWMTRFEGIEKQAQDMDEQMAKLDTTHRGIKRMQDELKDLSSLLDRRVKEITEMQRLAGEKFRAEWNTFAADDQKRWTNFTLSQKEQSKLLERQYKEGEDRISVLEDGLQDIEDQMAQVSKYTENQLQGLLSLMRDWAGDFEQIMDGFR